MKTNHLPWKLLLVCSLAVSTTVWAQTPQKPRIQSSASPEEIVHKPLGQKNTTSGDIPRKEKQLQEKTAKIQKKKRTATKGQKVIPPNKTRYLALKTNLAADIFAIHNLAFEMQVARSVSVELPVYWSLWDIEQKHGIRGVTLQPEARWWIGKVGKGHHFGIHAQAAWYNVKWNDNRYQTNGRPLLGAGMSYGYTLPLGIHWGAEFNIGFGYANMKHDTFYNVENGAFLHSRSRHYWGITRMGASLVYRF